MKYGAVAIMDVLGFKGIWQRYDPASVLSVMKSLEAMTTTVRSLLDEQQRRVWRFRIRPVFRFRFMSDTIFLSCWLSGIGRVRHKRHIAVSASLVSLCRLASLVVGIGAGAALPLRGCIAVGDFDALRNFVIGPAVDEAAEWAETADGAFVWLRPSAIESLEVSYPGHPEACKGLVYPYIVPLKSGSIRTAVIDPRGEEPTDKAERNLRELLTYFDVRKPGVQTKLENTAAFFDFVIREYAAPNRRS